MCVGGWELGLEREKGKKYIQNKTKIEERAVV